MKEIGAGRRALPRSDAKRHHIVPQFLLAKFAEPPAKVGGHLYQLDRKSGANRRVAVKSAATRRRFYAVETTEAQKDNRIEAMLGLAEHHAALSLKKLLEDPASMDEYDRIDIAMFLTIQTQRTSEAVARTEAFIQETAEQVLREHVADQRAFAKSMADVGGGLADPTLEEARLKLLKAVDEGRLVNRNIREEAWRLILDSWLAASEHPLRMSWVLLRPRSGEFVTSDAGFAGVANQAVDGAGETTETTFPLAPHACLMLRTGSPGLRFWEVPEVDVDRINLRTYAWAEQFIYGRTQAAVTGVRVLAKANWQRPRTAPRPAIDARAKTT
jgi:hypothetical protein